MASNADCPLVPLPSWWVSNGSPGGTVPQVGQFYGVQLTDSYSGVVDFRCSAFVGGLSVNSGTVRQSDPNFSTHGGQITVQMGFYWSGGTINDGPRPGFLNLAAPAQGTIAPTNSGTVNLGSTVTLFGHQFAPIGSTLTVKAGTVNLNDGDGFRAKPFSRLNFQAKTGPTGFVKLQGMKQALDQPVWVEDKANCVVETDGRAAEDDTQSTVLLEMADKGMFINDGTTTVRDRTKLVIRGAGNANGGYTQWLKAGAVTNLEAGSKISCYAGGHVLIAKGKLNIQPLLVNGEALANQPEATISNIKPDLERGLALRMEAGTELFMGGGAYNKLRVMGHFVTDGDTQLAVSRVSDASDKILVTDGDVIMDPITAKLTLRWGNPGAALTVPVGTEWLLIRCTTAGKKVQSLPNANRITVPSDPELLDLRVFLLDNERDVVLRFVSMA